MSLQCGYKWSKETERAAEAVLPIHETLTSPALAILCSSLLGHEKYRRVDSKGKPNVFGKDAPFPRLAGPRAQIAWAICTLCKFHL
ncbi:hypothetical protein J6590_017344 [Homalodisca vitripennis]|nr:hypothetical protein J6590_017344 [Homalodisca vitripennis]